MTRQAQPRGLSRRRVNQLLSTAKRDRSLDRRIDVISRAFLGRPYKPDPLIGSADRPEVFTASLNGFDCVTYIETVLALALASSAEDFVEWLRKIRYEGGRIQWERRNHYMTGWIRSNLRNPIIKPASIAALPALRKERVLNTVPGLPPQRTLMKCVPKRAMPRLAPRLQTGDLMFFVSTRKHLDVFHAGIIVRDGQRLLMRHASRSRGGVVEQKLSEFLKANRMAGVIIVRPHQRIFRGVNFVA
ncbi:MAG TPA: N-acetylmuramoyl-L-alanine amidase-like domain-containing protein [Patescibacteria group bacterium]|nr:N-acetylmuramoyl-L-alanine amidase-like domain-containing protein [Patescibacteria group bacterium]